MAGKKESEPLRMVAMNFYAADYELLKLVYESIGPQVAIRRIVREHCRKLREDPDVLSTGT